MFTCFKLILSIEDHLRFSSMPCLIFRCSGGRDPLRWRWSRRVRSLRPCLCHNVPNHLRQHLGHQHAGYSLWFLFIWRNIKSPRDACLTTNKKWHSKRYKFLWEFFRKHFFISSFGKKGPAWWPFARMDKEIVDRSHDYHFTVSMHITEELTFTKFANDSWKKCRTLA